MRFFLFISLFTAFLLGMTVEFGSLKPPLAAHHSPPDFLLSYQRTIKSHFEKPENANILFSFLTGNKNGISPHTKKAFKKSNLGFLLSPSSVHFATLFIVITFFLKKIKLKWLRHSAKAVVMASLFFISPFDSLKRLIFMKSFFHAKHLLKLKISLEWMFILTFGLSFLIGQYHASPLGYIYSFAFVGTFFALKDFSKVTLILGLFSTQLIITLFMGEKVSLAAIPCGLFGTFIFTFLFPVLVLFLMTFWVVPINWAEPLIKTYVMAIKMTSKLLTGTFTSSSLFLILSLWIIMFHPKSMRKYLLISSFIFLHTNTAMTPVVFS